MQRPRPMRTGVAVVVGLVIAASGCLYEPSGDDMEEFIDCSSYGVCNPFTGNLYATDAVDHAFGSTCPPSSAEQYQVGTCPAGCGRSASWIACDDTTRCTAAQLEPQCWEPPAEQGCPLAGQSCAVDAETATCDVAPACAPAPLDVGTCSCTAGAWACEAACADGMCSPDEVQTEIAGRWSGTRDGVAYPGTFDLLANGHYQFGSQTQLAPPFFFYGVSVDAFDLRIMHLDVIGQTASGAFANVTIHLGGDAYQTGTIHSIRLAGGTLTFTFVPSWLSCDEPHTYVLTRV